MAQVSLLIGCPPRHPTNSVKVLKELKQRNSPMASSVLHLPLDCLGRGHLPLYTSCPPLHTHQLSNAKKLTWIMHL